MKRVVHETLKGGRGIGESKEHYSRFKESFMSDKGSLPLVSILDTHVIIFPANIKFGENLCSLEFINKVGDKWEGVCIMDCVFIDIAVVLTGTEITIFLLNKEEGGCLWGV